MRPLSDGYVEAIAQGPETFHIVVIDGRRRVDCSRFATKFLTPDGVVVWDNSDRPKYQPGLDEMVAAGFRRLDLVGLTPLTNEVLTTSILYRDGNCLDL